MSSYFEMVSTRPWQEATENHTHLKKTKVAADVLHLAATLGETRLGVLPTTDYRRIIVPV